MKKEISAAKPTAARRRLLDAARVEFGLKGIECATTRAIAERAGCNEVTLFRQFESKQNLLAEVVAEASREFLLMADCDPCGNGNLVDDLTCAATACTASMERSEDMARALIGEAHRLPVLARELTGDVMAPVHARIAACLRERQHAGTVRADIDCEAFAEILTASLMGGVLRRGSGLSAIDRDTWTRRTVEFLARGIIAEPAP